MSRALFQLTATLLAATLLLSACGRPDSLQRLQQTGELRVISRNGPATYYEDKHGPDGFEYALARRFADSQGLQLNMSSALHLEDVFEQLGQRRVDIAAAGLSLTPLRQQGFLASEPYAEAIPQVIYRTGRTRPRSVSDLAEQRLIVLADSSHERILQQLQATTQPTLTWQSVRAADTMDLLQQVRSGAADLTIIDSLEFRVQQGLFPRLKPAFDLGEAQPLVWYVPPGDEQQTLLAAINLFIARSREDGSLQRLLDQHYGHGNAMSRVGSHTFARNLRSVLPEYRGLIRAVAQEYQLDWHLLAAIAYQESHWDPTATSPTGVRGMMMLTLSTAEELGVDDRLDPKQSLRGGARYLKNLRRRLPADISEPDRTWFALAAYNIGLGHLEDARVLTEHQDGNPDLWSDVRQRLPLLQDSAYYRSLRYGYARGKEAVNYVKNIRHYYNVLQWQDIELAQPRAPVAVEALLPASLRDIPLRAL